MYDRMYEELSTRLAEGEIPTIVRRPQERLVFSLY